MDQMIEILSSQEDLDEDQDDMVDGETKNQPSSNQDLHVFMTNEILSHLMCCPR